MGECCSRNRWLGPAFNKLESDHSVFTKTKKLKKLKINNISSIYQRIEITEQTSNSEKGTQMNTGKHRLPGQRPLQEPMQGRETKTVLGALLETQCAQLGEIKTSRGRQS